MKTDLPRSTDPDLAGLAAAWPARFLPALAWLDARLGEALRRSSLASASQAGADPFRGLHLSALEMAGLLALPPAAPVLAGFPLAGVRSAVDPDSRLGWLGKAYGLDDFEIAVLILALAPEADLRYERLYAFLQDDVTRRRPGVNLALDLFCYSQAGKLAARSAFSPDGRLVKAGILAVTQPDGRSAAPLLACDLHPDPQIVRLILGGEDFDRRLSAFCALFSPADKPLEGLLPAGQTERLADLLQAALAGGPQLTLNLVGPAGSGKRLLSSHLAGMTGQRLLIVDLEEALESEPGFETLPGIMMREAWLHSALLYLHGGEALFGEGRRAALRRLLEVIFQAPRPVIIGTPTAWPAAVPAPADLVRVDLLTPSYESTRRWWEQTLAERQADLADELMGGLAAGFHLTFQQVNHAAEEAFAQSRLNGGHPQPADLFAAARRQTRGRLDTLARLVQTGFTWEDLILPEDVLIQLGELCARARFSRQVLENWGFGRKLKLGSGTNALFAGSSGTGKTMAAGIVAASLGLDLFKIDLSTVVSKYIGETEKNLEVIFRSAAGSNAVLFFDEADALFGKRSEVRDSHDRYANVEISYLLQKMEEYEGIAILATNLRQNLDEAFVRRLAFTISFPFPDEVHRLRIWQGIWPPETPLAKDINLTALAQRFKLSGGNIKNVALAAAYLAAAEKRAVTAADLLHAIEREYQKLGKSLSAEELGALKAVEN